MLLFIGWATASVSSRNTSNSHNHRPPPPPHRLSITSTHCKQIRGPSLVEAILLVDSFVRGGQQYVVNIPSISLGKTSFPFALMLRPWFQLHTLVTLSTTKYSPFHSILPMAASKATTTPTYKQTMKREFSDKKDVLRIYYLIAGESVRMPSAFPRLSADRKTATINSFVC